MLAPRPIGESAKVVGVRAIETTDVICCRRWPSPTRQVGPTRPACRAGPRLQIADADGSEPNASYGVAAFGNVVPLRILNLYYRLSADFTVHLPRQVPPGRRDVQKLCKTRSHGRYSLMTPS